MERRNESFATGIRTLENISEGESFLPPWLFRHEGLLSALESARVLERRRVINRLNHLHFVGGRVFVLFSHPCHEEGILLEARPEPCIGEELTCRWDDPYSDISLENYRVRYLVIADCQSVILVPATLKAVGKCGLTVQLPEESYTLSHRQANRFVCQGTGAELLQHSFSVKGELVDFNPVAFRIKVRSEPSSHFPWYNPNVPATVRLFTGDRVIYSGPCRCVCMRYDSIDRDIVLAPIDAQINRFQPKKYRSPRRPISQFLMITFEHPFFKKRIQREIADISYSGFSIREKEGEGVLMPGMIIPDLSITYAGALHLQCSAQVIYRQEREEGIICGVVILDMNLTHYSRFSQIVGHLDNPHAHVSNIIDMDAFWEFLFDTGFIYPKKYRMIHPYGNDFKETYRKLYQESPEIARHFTYEKGGKIYAHASVIRAYERCWLGHHLAARPMEGKRMGLEIVKYVFDYLWSLARLPSANMDYLMIYFQTDNHFTHGIFGETAKTYGNPDHCSTHVFSYINYAKTAPKRSLDGDWVLAESSPKDLWEIELFYKHRYRGLIFDAMNLGYRCQREGSLVKTFEKFGFKRDIRIFSLLHHGKIAAAMIADRSDLGMDLAEFLNSIKILIIDKEAVPLSILYDAIGVLSDLYTTNEIPVLIHPVEYLEAMKVSPEKHYMLWILSGQYHMEYFDFIERHFGLSLSSVKA